MDDKLKLLEDPGKNGILHLNLVNFTKKNNN